MINSQILFYIFSHWIIIDPDTFSRPVLDWMQQWRAFPGKYFFVNDIGSRAQLAALCFSHSGAQPRQNEYKGNCKLRCLQSVCWIICVTTLACQTTADYVPLPHHSYCKWDHSSNFSICVLTCCSLIAGLYVFHPQRNSAVRLLPPVPLDSGRWTVDQF